jgi:hypothetical protein
MKLTNIFVAIIKSFYSRKFYSEAIAEWRGRSFLYLLLLLFICWAALAIRFFAPLQLQSFFSTEVVTVQKQLPVVKIKDGKASTAKPGPYYIRSSNGDALYAIIDTTNKIKNPADTKAMFIVKKNNIQFFNQQAGTVKTFSFEKRSLNFGPKQLKQYWGQYEKWLLPVIFIFGAFLGIFMLIFSFGYRVIIGIILGVVGLFYSWILRRRLDYTSVFCTSLVAMTPAIVVKTILSMFNVCFPFKWLLMLVLIFGYLFYAVLAAPKKNKKKG